jgi:HlyD family secretion protein
MVEKKKVLLPIVVLIALAVAGAAWWYSDEHNSEDQNRLVLYGNVDIREVDLAFNNSEHIERMLVQEGDRVKQGQLLASLDRGRVQAEVSAAQAKVDAQKAAVARLETGSRPQEVRQARASVAAAQAKLVDAKMTFERTRQLVKDKVASKQTMDDAQANFDMARADLKVAEELLALAVEGPRVEDIEEAKAVLKAQEAQLSLTQEVLKDTEMFAPSDGVIRNRILEPGDIATPQTPVYTMALMNPVWVRSYAPESMLGKLKPGMEAEVSTDSYPGKSYKGWIGYISPTAEFTPKNVETPELRTRLVYQLRVYVCNPKDELRLGMPATVTIPLDQPQPTPAQGVSPCSESGNG